MDGGLTPHLPILALCISSICLFLSRVLYNKMANSSSVAVYLARQLSLMWKSPERPQLSLLIGSVTLVSSALRMDVRKRVKDAEVVLCGGAKNMASYRVRNMHFRTKFGLDLKLEDSL